MPVTFECTILGAALSALGGFTLGDYLAAAESGRVAAGRAKSIILLYLLGGAATQDMFDLKPGAPAEVRGEFKPVPTSAPGVQICEHFPLMARMMDKVALIRSLHHKTGATHENGQRWMMTGHDFNPDSMKPYSGSVISRVFGNRGTLPASIILPGKIGNTGAGPLHGVVNLNAWLARNGYLTYVPGSARLGRRTVDRSSLRQASHASCSTSSASAGLSSMARSSSVTVNGSSTSAPT